MLTAAASSRPKVDDGAGLTAIEHAEVLSRELWNETPAPVPHHRGDGDQLDTRPQTLGVEQILGLPPECRRNEAEECFQG